MPWPHEHMAVCNLYHYNTPCVCACVCVWVCVCMSEREELLCSFCSYIGYVCGLLFCYSSHHSLRLRYGLSHRIPVAVSVSMYFIFLRFISPFIAFQVSFEFGELAKSFRIKISAVFRMWHILAETILILHDASALQLHKHTNRIYGKTKKIQFKTLSQDNFCITCTYYQWYE